MLHGGIMGKGIKVKTTILVFWYSTLVFGLVCSQGIYTEVNGQYFTSASAGEPPDKSFYPVSDYSDRIPELQRIVSVEAEETPVREVLEDIVGKAELGIAYNAGLLSLKRPDNIQIHDINVVDA